MKLKASEAVGAAVCALVLILPMQALSITVNDTFDPNYDFPDGP
jgi:hypothetical protein